VIGDRGKFPQGGENAAAGNVQAARTAAAATAARNGAGIG